MPTLSAITKILVAAVNLEERGVLPFTEIELILESWKRFPDDFGLKGYEQLYPDTHLVLCKIMGKAGLIRKSLLEQKKDRSLILTPKGRELAYDVSIGLQIELGTPTPTPLCAANGLSEDINKFLDQVVDSVAFTKYHFQEKDKISLREAQEFWSLSCDMKGEVIAASLEEFKGGLSRIQLILKGTSGELILHNGRVVSWGDLASVVEIDEYLQKRFGTIIRLLERRDN